MSRTNSTTTTTSPPASPSRGGQIVHAHCWWWNGFLKRNDVQCPDCARVASAIDIAKQSIDAYCIATTRKRDETLSKPATKRGRTSTKAQAPPAPSNARASSAACEVNLMRQTLHVKALHEMFGNHETTRWLVSAALLTYDSLRQAIAFSPPAVDGNGATAQPISSPIAHWTLLDVARIIYCSYHTPIEVARAIAKIEQRSPEWHLLRSGWCNPEQGIYRAMLNTSSVAAYLLKHKSGYSDPNRLVTEKLFAIKETFNDLVQNMLDRGTASEPDIILMFIALITEYLRRYRPLVQVSAQEVGIQINLRQPNDAASPDLILLVFDPETQVLWLTSGEMKRRGVENMAPYPSIPKPYNDQVQHTLNITKLPESFFICQATHTITVERFEYSKRIWESQMPTVQQYYWSVLYPAVILNAHGYFTPSDILKTAVAHIPPARVVARASEQYMNPLYATIPSPLISHYNAYREWWRSGVRDLLMKIPQAMSQFMTHALDGDQATSLAVETVSSSSSLRHWWMPVLIHPKKTLREVFLPSALSSSTTTTQPPSPSLQRHMEAIHMACRAVKRMLLQSLPEHLTSVTHPTFNAPTLDARTLQVIRQFVETPNDSRSIDAINTLADKGLEVFLTRAHAHATLTRVIAYEDQVVQYRARAQPWSWCSRFPVATTMTEDDAKQMADIAAVERYEAAVEMDTSRY